MGAVDSSIESRYQLFYEERQGPRVYPTEFVVRTFLARYPKLSFTGLEPGAKVLDVGFGDGRNTVFLCEQGFDVSGTEITQPIVDLVGARLGSIGFSADLRVGRNSRLGFDDASFDCILACHSCYYLDAGDTLIDNIREYARVLRPGGYLIASVADRDSYIFKGAEHLSDGSSLIANDPYSNRVGHRLHGFTTGESIIEYFAPFFEGFSIGLASNDYFGVHEKVFWLVARKAGK